MTEDMYVQKIAAGRIKHNAGIIKRFSVYVSFSVSFFR